MTPRCSLVLFATGILNRAPTEELLLRSHPGLNPTPPPPLLEHTRGASIPLTPKSQRPQTLNPKPQPRTPPPEPYIAQLDTNPDETYAMHFPPPRTVSLNPKP
jgi:hypothetical protein